MPQPLSKIETLLGFSVKSQQIIFGTDHILTGRKRQHLILYDADLSENSKNKLLKFAAERSIPIHLSQSSLSVLLHKNGVKAVSLLNPDMANEIIKQLIQ